MSDAALTEAYERFHRTGPEWGADQLTNHGPMAVEVLVRRGRAEAVPGWVDAYIRRLDELPRATGEITDASWPQALGDGRRIGDWTAYLTRQLTEQPWRQVLATWWPRLLPGIAAGATHGVIRTGHVVRTLLTTEDNAPTVDELAHALAFWAARSRSVPPSPDPAGSLDPLAALDAVPRIARQQGNLAARFGQLTEESGWPASVGRLRPAATPDQVQARLADLVAAATLRYLSHGHGQPVLLVHTATAPNAVLHTLPALPASLWAPSMTAVWAASAAIFAAYAPPEAAHPEAAHPEAAHPQDGAPTLLAGPDAAVEVLDRAVAHGDEHVIKFTDTAAEAYARTGQPGTLAAALRAAALIPSPRS
ncbi:MAG: questin oxidase family protein [Streptosporangiaceae bacterium]